MFSPACFPSLFVTFPPILEFEACAPGEFQCNNGRCLDIRRKCNSYDECGDGSDEVDCGKWELYVGLFLS